MPREKKQRLKKRRDGYYVCRYKDQWFYSMDPDEPLRMREEYKRLERLNLTAVPTVSEYGKKWFDRTYVDASFSTKNQMHIHLRKLTDLYGDLPVTSVKPSQIKSVYSSAYLGMSASYIRAGKNLFCALFDAIVADGYLRTNPARDKSAKPQKGTSGSHRQITPQERIWIETLCTDHRVWPAVMTMLYSGIRPQEMKALKIDRDVDFKAEIITLHETAHRADFNHYAITKKGKTAKAMREIPLFPPLKDALTGRTGYVITCADGSQITVGAWKRAWESYVVCMEEAINGCRKRWYGRTKEHRKILDEGGKLPPWIEFTVVPYDLRHSFCCMCRDNGVELNTCIRWMGHADEKMVLRIYDEASDNRSAKEAEKLKKTLFHSGNGSREETEHAESIEK